MLSSIFVVPTSIESSAHKEQLLNNNPVTEKYKEKS
jgi:hypothetical protein